MNDMHDITVEDNPDDYGPDVKITLQDNLTSSSVVRLTRRDAVVLARELNRYLDETRGGYEDEGTNSRRGT